MKLLKRLLMTLIILSTILIQPIAYAKEKDTSQFLDTYYQEHSETSVGMAISLRKENQGITNYYGYEDKENKQKTSELSAF